MGVESETRSGMEILLILSAIILTTGAETDNIVFIESLSNLKHDVQGKLFAVGSSQLLLTEFSYDGQGPDAFFMVGTSGTPGESGIILPYPADGKTYEYYDQNAPVLQSFDYERLVLDLPDSVSVSDITWVSVWCRQFSINFGSVTVPSGIDFSSLEVASQTSNTQTTRWPPAIVSTTTRSPIIVDTNVNVEWEQVGACFSYMKKRSWEIVPGILEGFSAQVLLPYLGRRVTMMVPGMTTMVAAYANNGDYLGKLNSDDGKSWTLDLEGNQDPELILLFTVRTGNSWSHIQGMQIDGRNIDLCEEGHEGEGIGERSNPWNPILVTERKSEDLPSCVEVDMAVYGHNAAVEQNVASALDCWELCQVYPSCRFWNYNKFSADTVAWSGNKGRCHIKTQKGENPGTKSGYTFGSRDCRPE